MQRPAELDQLRRSIERLLADPAALDAKAVARFVCEREPAHLEEALERLFVPSLHAPRLQSALLRGLLGAIRHTSHPTAAVPAAAAAAGSSTAWGVVLDWLAFTDCDLENEEMQNAVVPLAATAATTVPTGPMRWSRHLAAVAIHGASWKSLHRCFARLLEAAEERGAGKGETRAGAGELVELAEAYLAHPRSWRPNADVPPPPSRAGSLTRAYSLYPLSPRAARALFGLVAAEATEAAATAAATGDGDPDAALRRSIAGRMPFLLPTVATARDNLASVVEVLRREEEHSDAARELLAQLYLIFPAIVSAPSSSAAALSEETSSRESAMSSVVQRAVKRLMDEGAWNGAYLTLRNIAVAHPALVLRHLNTLAALIEGRVPPSQKEFLEKHHRLYLNVLTILDALRPHVFHSRWLDRVLEAYFNAISAVCGSYNKALSGLLAKFAEFLCAFAVAVPRLRALLTPPRQKLLAEVQQVYLEVRQLGTLLALLAEQDLGLWSLSEWPPAAAAAAVGSGGGPLVTTPAAPLSDAEVQATRAHLRLPPASVAEEAGGREKLLDTLSDLEMASLRSPGVLQLFLEDLLDLLDPHAVPSFHFGVLPLLLRFLHHSPRDAAVVMPRYLECLVSPVDDIVRESLKYAPEYFPFAQDCYAHDMLSRLFELTLTRPLVGATVPLKNILLSSFQLM